MAEGASDRLLGDFSRFVAGKIGLQFDKARWPDLQRGVVAAAAELGFPDANSYMRDLMSAQLTQARIEMLASYLTIGETYFFRDKASFEALEKTILPDLIQSRRGQEQRMRIWSAGCATGEEAYTLAIVINRLIPDLESWELTILGTDINQRALNKAVKGIYGQWSFRGAPDSLKKTYFHKTNDGRFEVKPKIKKLVTFSYLNLIADSYPSLATNTNGMDLVLCRNVLMYFSMENAKLVAEKLHKSIVESGWLVTSATEVSATLFPMFSTVRFPGANLYQKTPPKPQAAPAPQQSLPARTTISRVPEPLPQTPQTLQLSDAEKLYKKGDYAQVTEVLMTLLRDKPTDVKAKQLLARSYANLGRLQEALTLCEQAVTEDKLNPAQHYLRGVILQEEGHRDEAAISFRRALYLDPNFVVCYFALGNLLRGTNESLKHFDNALSSLQRYDSDEVLPESEGITAGRLAAIISSSRVIQ